MTIAVREQAIFAAIEAVYNVAETLVGADVIQIEELQPNPVENLRIIERNVLRASLAPEKHQYGGSLFGLQFKVELKGSGAAGTAPRIGRLLRACGMGETVVASTSVTYEPSSDFANHDSLTIAYKEGGNLRTLTGCRGNMTLEAESGRRIMARFTFVGHIASEAVAAAPAQSVETTQPPVFIDADVQAGGDAIVIGKFSSDLGNTLGIADDPNSADGFGAIRVTARRVVGSMNPEAKLISDKDFIGELRAATSFAIQTGVLGDTAGNQVAISWPACAWTGVSPGDRESLLIYELPFGAYPSSGDDDIAIQFT